MEAERGFGKLGIGGEGHNITLHFGDIDDLKDAINSLSRLLTRISDQKRVPNKQTFTRMETTANALTKILRATAQLNHKLGLDKDPQEHGDPSYYKELEAACRDKALNNMNEDN